MDPKDKLSVEEYNQREVHFAVRSLFAINGTGLIALLAFLGQIWNSHPQLRGTILDAMGGMLLGIILAMLSTLTRLRSMDRALKGKPKPWFLRAFLTRRFYSSVRVLSFLSFVAAVGYLILSLRAAL